MKKTTAFLLCIVLLFSVTGCDDDMGPKEITILTLDSYLSMDNIKEFTKDTGIVVNQVTVSSYEEIQALVEQDPYAYDVVIACDYVMDALVKGNLLQEIDYKKFSNYKYVTPGYTGKYYDPDNKFTVPYAAIGVLIGYNPAKAGIIIDSYVDLLAPELKDSIVFADDPSVVVGVTNMMLDRNPDFFENEEMGDVTRLLTSLAKNHCSTDNSVPYREDLLVNGQASVGVLYTMQLGYAVASNPDIEIVYPKEGFICSIDCMAIPSGSDSKDYAMQFINYAHDPVVNGKLTQEIGYSSANISGKQFMDEEYRNDGYNIKNEKATESKLFKKQSDLEIIRFEGMYNKYFLSETASAEPQVPISPETPAVQ